MIAEKNQQQHQRNDMKSENVGEEDDAKQKK